MIMCVEMVDSFPCGKKDMHESIFIGVKLLVINFFSVPM